jgi:hypothetical protein
MTTKTLDARGRLSLGADMANQMFFVEEREDCIVLTRAEAVPAREAWLHKNKAAMASVLRGIDQFNAGQVVDATAQLKADAKLVSKLGD